jgi:coenzyme F420 hydrogenase subunit beta
MGETILDIYNAGLCTACGICAGVCPQYCIKMILKDGQPTPYISSEKCTRCGICRKVCPQSGFDYKKYNGSSSNFWIGDYKKILKAQSRNASLLKMATSGGIVTQLVKNLLEDKIYDSVFTVGTYNHREVSQAEDFNDIEFLKRTPKSRYVMVSHEKTVRYMKENKNARLIIVATPCVLHGLINAIELFRLRRDNYLFIGLFCDKTMTNKIFYYFENVFGDASSKLDKIHFRTKEVGGWPGGVRLFWENGQITDLSNKERTKVKEYYQPEGCMYCIDKVNYLADISVGDNYADSNADVRGSSSVILRTKTAVEIWERYKESFVYELENEENIFRAQKLGDRERNLIYAMYKGISYKLPENFVFENRKHYGKSSYRKALQKVANGKCRDYRYIYRKSRHNSKKILTLFCGLFGRVKKAGMVCTKRR